MTIQLASDEATIECGSCGGSASYSTLDREALVAGVRSFLKHHDSCRSLDR